MVYSEEDTQYDKDNNCDDTDDDDDDGHHSPAKGYNKPDLNGDSISPWQKRLAVGQSDHHHWSRDPLPTNENVLCPPLPIL